MSPLALVTCAYGCVRTNWREGSNNNGKSSVVLAFSSNAKENTQRNEVGGA